MTVEVLLDSASRTPVERITLDFTGEAVTPGDDAARVTTRFMQRAALAGETELTEGEHRYRARFTVPPDAPAAFRGSVVEIRYRLALHVVIPWWADLREAYDVTVVSRPLRRAPRAPIASTSLRRNEPFVEVALDDAAYAPGDVIGGSIAVGNVDRARVRGVELSLLGFEEDRLSDAAPREATRFTASLALDEVTGGREIPLRFEVPRAAAPSFACPEAGLGWAFEVRLDMKGAGDVIHRVPLTIAVFDGPASPAPMRRLVGAGRWSAVWADVGRTHGLSLGEGELELAGAVDGAWVTVRTRVHEGHGQLTAELRWAPWGIDITVAMRRFIDMAGIEVDDTPFGRRFKVKGREPAQVRSALPGRLRRALLGFDEVRLDDDHAVVRSDAPGHDQPWIGAFVNNVATLAAAIRAASERIPPPAALGGALPAFRAFAAAHGGELCVGAMSLRGAIVEGARFDLVNAFEHDGTPAGAILRLAVDPELSKGFDHEDPEALAAAPPAARTIVAGLKKPGRTLTVEPARVTLELGAPLADPETERDTLAAILGLVAALRGDRGAGPYR